MNTHLFAAWEHPKDARPLMRSAFLKRIGEVVASELGYTGFKGPY